MSSTMPGRHQDHALLQHRVACLFVQVAAVLDGLHPGLDGGVANLQAERAFDALEESIRSQAVAIAKQYGMTFNIEAD